MALQLKRAGIKRVRPLAGGFEVWRDLGFPVEPVGDVVGAERLDTAVGVGTDDNGDKLS